jgi:hypothetical protein
MRVSFRLDYGDSMVSAEADLSIVVAEGVLSVSSAAQEPLASSSTLQAGDTVVMELALSNPFSSSSATVYVRPAGIAAVF